MRDSENYYKNKFPEEKRGHWFSNDKSQVFLYEDKSWNSFCFLDEEKQQIVNIENKEIMPLLKNTMYSYKVSGDDISWLTDKRVSGLEFFYSLKDYNDYLTFIEEMDKEKYVEFIKEKHKKQKRIQGTPYYIHPLQVSFMLWKNGFPKEYQITGLFHDLLEDTDTTYDEILNMTNPEIANAVKLLTKEKGYIMSDYIEHIKQNDIARIVKLADRIHNLSELHMASLKFQEKYIKETEEWFVDLAKDTIFERMLEDILGSSKNRFQELNSDEKKEN